MIRRLNVPVAKDGTFFRPSLSSGGVFTVGDKMAEKTFTDYTEALVYLKCQPTARWRRPNFKGNRGIVTAVVWDYREINSAEASGTRRGGRVCSKSQRAGLALTSHAGHGA